MKSLSFIFPQIYYFMTVVNGTLVEISLVFEPVIYKSKLKELALFKPDLFV